MKPSSVLSHFASKRLFGFQRSAKCESDWKQISTQLAQTFQRKANLTAKDAIHLACAEFIQASAFITCDDSLIKRAKRPNLSIMFANPVDYIRHEED